MLRLWILAAGLLTASAVGMAFRRRRAHNADVKLDTISSDWLAEARGRDEHTP